MAGVLVGAAVGGFIALRTYAPALFAPPTTAWGRFALRGTTIALSLLSHLVWYLALLGLGLYSWLRLPK